MNRAQLRYLVKKGSIRAAALSRVLEKPEWLLSTTLLGANLAQITLNSFMTVFVIERFGAEYEFWTILVTAPLLLFFGEALPKAIFQRFADRIATHLVFPLRIVSWALSPLVAGVAIFAKLVTAVIGLQSAKRTPLVTREELELVFQASERQQGVKDLERRMIDRIFAFSDRQVSEIMIPLVDVVSIRDDSTLSDAAVRMRQSGYSRLPIYANRVDHIIGWVNHYDLLLSPNRTAQVRDLLRPIRFVPTTVVLSRLLVTMQKAGDNLACVVNEYGGVVGMVTLEDVIEQVVGDIEDEYDTVSPLIRRPDAHRMLVDARVDIDKLNEVLPQPITPGDYETLAGFLTNVMQRVPTEGEKYVYRKMIFHVLKANPRGIDEVEIFI
jgi:CBS domain containing-hemolysin-like protein